MKSNLNELSHYVIEQMTRQTNALNKIYEMCGGMKPEPDLLGSLLLLEKNANVQAVNYCNGDIDSVAWDKLSQKYHIAVQAMFNGNLQGLLVNGDPRGYTLKISDSCMRGDGIYAATRLHTDFGGYGILAPEIIDPE